MLGALGDTWRRFARAEVPLRAAALAFHSLLAIVPVVGLVFWYLSHIHVLDRWIEDTKHFILAQLNVDSSSTFLAHFQKLTATVGGRSWGWIGLLILLYTAWNLIAKFGKSLDVVLETQLHRPSKVKNRWSLALRRVIVMIGMPIAVTISLAVTNWIQKDSILHDLFKVPTIGPLFALPIAWGAVITAYFFVYHFVPSRLVPWREALKAAVIAGPLSEVVREAFGLYTHYALSVQRLYGVFAVIPLFILWMQIAWLIALGAALVIRFEPPAHEARKKTYATLKEEPAEAGF